MQTHRIYLFLLVSFTAVLLTACAPTQVIKAKRLVWPLPPDEPRIEFIAAYSGSPDLREASLFRRIAGDDDGTWLFNPMMAIGDNKSRMYVSDKERVAVFMFDFAARDVIKLGGTALDGLLKHANGIAIDAQGLVYVADSLETKIYVVDPATQTVVKSLNLSAHLKSIARFAIDKRAGRLVMPDAASNKIVITDLQGKHILSFGKRGNGDGEFNSPQSLTVDSKGNIVVCDVFNARIQRFTSDGAFINAFGKRGDKGGDLALAKGVAVDSEGHIYVTDARENRITIFSDKGEYLLSFGFPHAQQPGSNVVAGGFLLPQGISIDENDRIYVADQQNARVQIFQYLNARYLQQNPISPDQLPKLPPPDAAPVK